jgi:hypothetical protein
MLAPPPPLHPSGDEGRRLLREELLHREYHSGDLWSRLLDWLWRRFQGGVGTASGWGDLATFVALVLVAALVLALVCALTRLRHDRRRRSGRHAVLPEHHASAADLRRRAEAALAEGRHEDAVVEAFRAVAAHQVERGRLDDQPGATAHEVAATLAATYPDLRERVGRTADLFDATLYGRRPATRDDAVSVLSLDDALAGVR